MDDILEFLEAYGFEIIIREDLEAIQRLANENYKDLLCLPDDVADINPPEICIEPPAQVDEPEVPAVTIPSSIDDINGCIDNTMSSIKTFLASKQASRERYGSIDQNYENYLVLRAKVVIYYYLLISKIDDHKSKAGVAITQALEKLVSTLSLADYLEADEQFSNAEVLALVESERQYFSGIMDSYKDGSYKDGRTNIPNAKSIYEQIATRIINAISNRLDVDVVVFAILTEANNKALDSGAINFMFGIDQNKISDIDYITNLPNTRASNLTESLSAINEAVDTIRVGSNSYYKSVVKDKNLKTLLNTFLGLADELNDELDTILTTYVDIDTSITETRINRIITSNDCTKDIDISLPDSLPTIVDIEHRTFSEASLPSLLDIGYWVRYSNLLTIVNLIPAYWSVGIIVPTPGGPVPINLPVIWKPVFVNYTPPIVNVLFITINGVVVFPVLWQLRMKPLADESSILVTMPRGANIKIKSKTGSQAAGIAYVDNIDISPEVSRTLPITKDDLPSYERLSINNAALVAYLNQWISKSVPYMGLI